MPSAGSPLVNTGSGLGAVATGSGAGPADATSWCIAGLALLLALIPALIPGGGGSGALSARAGALCAPTGKVNVLGLVSSGTLAATTLRNELLFGGAATPCQRSSAGSDGTTVALILGAGSGGGSAWDAGGSAATITVELDGGAAVCDAGSGGRCALAEAVRSAVTSTGVRVLNELPR